MGLYVGNKFVIDNGSIIYKSSSTSGIGSTENIKIIPSEKYHTDLNFGKSVAVGSGKIVVATIGAGGTAYIYDLEGNNEIIKKIHINYTNDQFGSSLAVGSGRIVVGADGDDDNGTNSGAAYIFDLDGDQLNKITASDPAVGDWFGKSVAVGNGRIVVGAIFDYVGSNSNQGSAYIYDLDGNNEVKITASDGAANDEFGNSVAVGNGRIVVGAHKDDSLTGAAYIFDLNGNQLRKITASNGAEGDRFGFSVAVGSGRIVVGAYLHDVNVPPGYSNNAGSVYIYDLDGNQLGIITASDGGGYFGTSVAVGCGRIVVGATGSGAGGAAYVYDLDGNNEVRISSSDNALNDQFGFSVAVGSGRIVVGAYGDEYYTYTNLGAAYIWKIDELLSDYYDEIVDNYRY